VRFTPSVNAVVSNGENAPRDEIGMLLRYVLERRRQGSQRGIKAYENKK
jgi:hypothetical protein